MSGEGVLISFNKTIIFLYFDKTNVYKGASEVIHHLAFLSEKRTLCVIRLCLSMEGGGILGVGWAS